MGHSDGSEPLLRRLLKAAGYRLEERPIGLRAERSRDRRTVLVVESQRSPADLEPEFPTDALHRTVIYPEDPGEAARELASQRGIEVLDPTTLGPALGELLLPAIRADGETEAPSPLEPPATIFPDGRHTVQPRLGALDAQVIAGVEGFRAKLRLIPYFVAPYRVRTPRATGGPGPATDHLVAVDALTGRVEIWEVGERELGDDPPEADERYEPRIAEPGCREAAERELKARHSISIDHTEQHGGTIVIERRRVAPGPDDLKVGAGIFVYVPYWYVEGRDGRVVIDAVNGSRSRSEATPAT